MKFDIFFSICQNEVDGEIPSEQRMWKNFFDQVILADELGFETAWVAETHLSCEVQKQNPNPVIPHFNGEIGLNTDILQLAHKVYACTKNINIGSAIRNILCNGGPLAHAEAVRTFLALHNFDPNETRRLELGFAAGRFPFSNKPYGIFPRNDVEKQAWPVLRGLIFREATEIFLRFLKGEEFSSEDVTKKVLKASQFRTPEDWQKVVSAFGQDVEEIEIPSFWSFEKVGVVPKEVSLDLLNLTIGSHDAVTQELANKILPCGVFNLSITPSAMIEATHQRMKESFHPDGGVWSRSHMPRTVLIFIDEDEKVAQQIAQKTMAAYWTAMEGTLNEERVQQAVDNALVGTPEQIHKQVQERFHSDDRLMLWFDFNNHDNADVQKRMKMFCQQVFS